MTDLTPSLTRQGTVANGSFGCVWHDDEHIPVETVAPARDRRVLNHAGYGLPSINRKCCAVTFTNDSTAGHCRVHRQYADPDLTGAKVDLNDLAQASSLTGATMPNGTKHA